MHAAARARRLCRILKPPVHVSSAGFVPPNDRRVAECARIRAQACRDRSSSFSSAAQSLGFAVKGFDVIVVGIPKAGSWQ
ncbi:hypothetical protein EUGRSUZ_H03798 [Eucalyptus grandis]|uniref:Uncharacterized protein n=2 Tax=Eucalyptus grandis TaxID=71139 RepID=A0ACC3JV63_EUCGR|nr:hypothetical protein EUGRSUZ_H03798 [Eucalyptus grandis]